MAKIEWHYTQDDFMNSTEPFEEIYKLRDDPFRHERALSSLAIYAKSVGVINFKKIYESYKKSLRGDKATESGKTSFSDQKMELETGEWEADENGVYRGFGVDSVCACPHPIMPVERLVNIDTGVEKLKLAYRKGKNWREIIVEKSTLATASKVTSLADRGVSVTSETAKAFVQYISDVENLNYDEIPERKSIGRLGYIPGEGFSPYVDGLIFDGDANFSQLFKCVKHSGSYDAWLEMARECRKMSVTARIILSASFASVLLEPLGCLPFFVHLWGVDSGTGKTVALMLAASVWGDPAVGQYVKTFDATVVGHEKTAAFLNHLPLCLDELQLAKDGKGRTQFDVYKLAQGVGRTRGNRGGGVDKTPTWRNCILTTGESPLTSSGAGAGAVNRVIDIECKASEAVITDGMRVANCLKGNYGFAGRLFVETIYGADTAIETIREKYREIFKELSSRDTTEKQAMAAAAILVADQLVTAWFFQDGLGLTPEIMGEFLASKATVSAGERGFAYLCDWVAQNSVKFIGGAPDGVKGEVLGLLDAGEAFIIRSAFDKAASDAGFSPKALLSWLNQNGKIRTRAKNRTLGKRINGVNVECVCLILPAPEWAEDDDENDILP